jgi:hypothetical protein
MPAFRASSFRASRTEYRPLPLTLAWGTPDQVDSDEPPPCKPAAKTAFPSARCSIVAAAFHGAKGIGLA